MFSKALKAAFKYTRPIVVSRRTVAGDCSASIGAFVVVNADGWIVTAGHVLEQVVQLENEVTAVQNIQAQRTAIQNDAALGHGEKRRRTAQLPKINSKATDRWSIFSGWLGTSLADISFISGVDIGVAKLQGFDPTWVDEYPIFKDPTRDFNPGTSLCRLGFPFHQVKPIWDGPANMHKAALPQRYDRV